MSEKEHNTEKNGNASKIFWAFLLGGLAGGLIALLYAPKSGKETREGIKDEAENTKQEVTEQIQSIKESIQTKYYDTKERFKAAVEAGREAFVQKPIPAELPMEDEEE